MATKQPLRKSNGFLLSLSQVQDLVQFFNDHKDYQWKSIEPLQDNIQGLVQELNDWLEVASLSAESKVFTWLLENDMNPFYVPTIAELGKTKNGFALVKAIQAEGGLRKFRMSYAEFINSLDLLNKENNQWILKKLSDSAQMITPTPD